MSQNERFLAGKTVLITGGSSGLGEQIAYKAAEAGAVVVVAARRLDKLHKVAVRCAALSGTRAEAVQLDVADLDDIARVVDRVLAEFGPIDILVNNAGFGYFAEAVDLDMEVAERMFRVNVLGLMHITQRVARHMKERGKGAYHQHRLAGRQVGNAQVNLLFGHQIRSDRVFQRAASRTETVRCECYDRKSWAHQHRVFCSR